MSPTTADPGSAVAVGKPTLSDLPSNPPSGADPGPTNTGIYLVSLLNVVI
jgi:hypothetical protein